MSFSCRQQSAYWAYRDQSRENPCISVKPNPSLASCHRKREGLCAGVCACLNVRIKSPWCPLVFSNTRWPWTDRQRAINQEEKKFENRSPPKAVVAGQSCTTSPSKPSIYIQLHSGKRGSHRGCRAEDGEPTNLSDHAGIALLWSKRVKNNGTKSPPTDLGTQT